MRERRRAALWCGDAQCMLGLVAMVCYGVLVQRPGGAVDLSTSVLVTRCMLWEHMHRGAQICKGEHYTHVRQHGQSCMSGYECGGDFDMPTHLPTPL